MFRDVGLIEFILIILVILLIFGAGKLPTIGRALGKAVRELRESSKEEPVKENKTKPSVPALNIRRRAGKEQYGPENPDFADRDIKPSGSERIPIDRPAVPSPTVTIQFTFSSPVKIPPRQQVRVGPNELGAEPAAQLSAREPSSPAPKTGNGTGTGFASRLKRFFSHFGKSK